MLVSSSRPVDGRELARRAPVAPRRSGSTLRRRPCVRSARSTPPRRSVAWSRTTAPGGTSAMAGSAVGVAGERRRRPARSRRARAAHGRLRQLGRPTTNASVRGSGSRTVRAVVLIRTSTRTGSTTGSGSGCGCRAGSLPGLQRGRGQHEAGDAHAPSIGRPERPRSPSVGRLIDHHRAARDGRLAALARDPRPRRVAHRDHRRPAGLERGERLAHADGNRARPQPPRLVRPHGARPAQRDRHHGHALCRAPPGTRRGGTASPPPRGRTCLPGR